MIPQVSETFHRIGPDQELQARPIHSPTTICRQTGHVEQAQRTSDETARGRLAHVAPQRSNDIEE
jgi:hypothetical protein